MGKILQIKERVAGLWKSKVVAGALKYMGAHVLMRVVGFFLLPIWTRYLSPTEFGIVGTLNAYMSFLAPMMMLGIQGSLVRFFHEHKEDNEGWKSYYSSNLYFLLLVNCVLTAGLLMFGEPVWNYVSSGSIAFNPYAQLAILGLFFGVIVRLVDANLRARQAHSLVVGVKLWKFFLGTTTGLVLVIGFKMGALGAITGTVIATVVTALILLFGTAVYWLNWSFKLSSVQSALSFGLPLVPHAIAGTVMSISDQIILEKYRSLEEVGLYCLAAQLAAVMSFVVVSINQAWSPRFYELMNDHDEPRRKMVQYTNLWLVLVGLVSLGIGLFGSDLIVWMTPIKYHKSALVVTPLVLSSLFTGMYFWGVNPLFFLKKTALIPLLTGGSAVCNILLNLLFIPSFGMQGAAATTLVTNVLCAIVCLRISLKLYPVAYPWLQYMFLIGIVSTGLLVGLFLEPGTIFSTITKTTICVFSSVACWLIYFRNLNQPST